METDTNPTASGTIAAAPDYGPNAVIIFLHDVPEPRKFIAGETVTIALAEPGHTIRTMNLPTYHTSADGTIPCANSCGDSLVFEGRWMHKHWDGYRVACLVEPYEGQAACPLPPNDCDPDFYDERGWARR